MRASYSVLYRRSIVGAGEDDQLFIPGRYRMRYGAILFHGLGAPTEFANLTQHQSVKIAPFLALAGIPVLAAEMGGDTHGNDASLLYADSAYAVMAASGVVNPGKVHLLGVSMGFGTAIRWASANPTKVASITGILPASSLINTYNNNVAGLRASIGTAWGIAWPTPLPIGADYVAHGIVLRQNLIPSQLYYSPIDAVIPQADVLALSVALGSEATVGYDPNGSGHTEAGIGNMGDYLSGRWSETIKFMKKYGA